MNSNPSQNLPHTAYTMTSTNTTPINILPPSLYDSDWSTLEPAFLADIYEKCVVDKNVALIHELFKLEKTKVSETQDTIALSSLLQSLHVKTFYKAIYENDENIMDLLCHLLPKQINSEKENWFGQTPLYEAVRTCKINSAYALIKNKAEINVINQGGMTILAEACMQEYDNKYDFIDMLFRFGANPNLQVGVKYLGKKTNSEPSIHLLFSSEFNTIEEQLEILPLFLKNNVNLNLTNRQGQNALMKFLEQLGLIVYTETVVVPQIVSNMLEHGVNTEHKTLQGEGVEHYLNKYSYLDPALFTDLRDLISAFEERKLLNNDIQNSDMSTQSPIKAFKL